MDVDFQNPVSGQPIDVDSPVAKSAFIDTNELAVRP
jgi:hypothetical protein